MWDTIVWINRAVFLTVELAAFANKNKDKIAETLHLDTPEEPEPQEDVTPEQIQETQREEEKHEWDIVNNAHEDTENSSTSHELTAATPDGSISEQ